MSKTMLYRHPRSIKSNDESKGYCTIKGVEFDWIIVDKEQIDSCLKEGFSLSPDDAIGEEKSGLTIEDIKSKTADEIKELYTVKEMKALAKELGIVGLSKAKENEVVEKLLEYAE